MDLARVRKWCADQALDEGNFMKARTRDAGGGAPLLDNDPDAARELCRKFGVVGDSPSLLKAALEVLRLHRSDAPVLLLGESGTGKERFARMLHHTGPHADGPFVTLDCGAVPGPRLDSQLFGHDPDTQTGAQESHTAQMGKAQGGTLFLDGIEDLDSTLQVRLLRMLQERRIEPTAAHDSAATNFRLVTATHVDLSGAVQAGRFRLDLFFRLSVIPIVLPPLRERATDVALLADHFLHVFGLQYGRSLRYEPGAHARLCRFSWPGNVRQLQNVIERAVLQNRSDVVSVAFIDGLLDREADFLLSAPPTLRAREPAPAHGPSTRAYRPYSRVEASQRAHIVRALDRAGGNRTRAAALLGLTPRQLRYKLAKLAIEPEP